MFSRSFGHGRAQRDARFVLRRGGPRPGDASTQRRRMVARAPRSSTSAAKHAAGLRGRAARRGDRERSCRCSKRLAGGRAGLDRHPEGRGGPRRARSGAAIVNDVSGLRGDPAMARVAADTERRPLLMHMQGEPRTMQDDPRYDDVVCGGERASSSRARVAVERASREERIASTRASASARRTSRTSSWCAGSTNWSLSVGPSSSASLEELSGGCSATPRRRPGRSRPA